MTEEEFWKKYNHCPLCEEYTTQGEVCWECRWHYPGAEGYDHFYPTTEACRRMAREIDG